MNFDKKHEKTSRRRWTAAVVAALAALIVGLVVMILGQEPVEIRPDASGTSETRPSSQLVQPEPDPIALDCGLEISRVGAYAGMFMEDGTNEIVSDVMMIIVKNTTQQDLQLARIDIAYDDFTAEFEVTNLPAGKSAVLLEKNRRAAAAEAFRSVGARNVVFFPEPMTLREECIAIEGYNGCLKITNTSGQDISGDIYIYYKNYVDELYYGGITYRAKASGGLAAGETKQIMTGHYTADSSRFVLVTCGD